MSDFDPDAYLAEKRSKKAKDAPAPAGDFDPDAYLAERRAVATAETSPPKKSDYEVSTAIDRAGVVKEAKDRARGRFAADRATSAVESAGYGAARAGTLGAVDRLVGLGTSLGENLGATEQTPADPNAYQKGRDEYLAGERESERLYPKSNFVGNVAGGMVSTAALSPLSVASKLANMGKTGKVAQGLGRAADAGLIGGASGALNTYKDDPVAMLGGAAIGAATGVGLDATLGNLARRAIRGAPQREENAFVRDVVESEAGRATPTTGRKLALDLEDVVDMRKQYPEVAKATRHSAPAAEALPVTRAAQESAMAGQAERYVKVDEALGKKGQLTDVKLLQALVKAEDELPNFALSEGKRGLEKMREALRNDFVPRWTGSAINKRAVPITTDQLRQFVTTAQGTAEAAMGSINGTNASRVPKEVAKVVNNILERRLDSAAAVGASAEVAAIREADRRFSALSRIEAALNDRALREKAQAIGLQKRLSNAGADAENSAAAALALSGRPEAAIGVKLRGPASRAYDYTAREVNDRLLKPLQDAAAAGKSWAEVSRMAAEIGAPQGVARVLYDNINDDSSKNKAPKKRR